MINPHCFNDRNLEVGCIITLESHNSNHTNSKITIIPNYPEFGNGVRYINKMLEELSVIYARLINQYKFRYQTVSSATFDKQGEDNQVLDETELFKILNVNQNLTETDIKKFDVKSPSEHQIQQQEMKDSGWRFDKIVTMTIYFYKTGDLNGSNYVKIPLRSNAILNIENINKFCFLWSILAKLYPCKNNHTNRVSNYKQYLNELNIQGFDFSNGFKCTDVHRFNELITLSVNIFEKKFHQDQNKWSHKLIPIENSKNILDRVIELGIYKNHYIPI